MLLKRALLCGFTLLAFGAAVRSDVDAQARQNPKDQDAIEALAAQRRAEERKSDANRQTARDIALEVEDLRHQIIDISKKQGVGETRAAIYRARLDTINLQETDITRQLTAMRDKESRLLAALQIYSRNPPPVIFISTHRANDAVMAAILIKAITPELKKRTEGLAQQNARLVNLRREAALQNEALLVSENDVSEQRRQIEALIDQKLALEDQLLGQADQMQARAADIKAREDRLRGTSALKSLLGFAQSKPDDRTHLVQPVIGDKVRSFGQRDAEGPASRGVSFSTLPGSQVTAPAEGEVEYAGPVDSYGQVVIINIGHNYHVVITGIGRVYVEKGRTVGRHEPIGRMPNLSDKKTTLYMELRRGEDPVNPDINLQLARK